MSNHISRLLKVAGPALLFFLISACSPARNEVTEVLFSPTEAYPEPYRIPAVAQFSDGRVLALTDYRPCKLDIGFGRVDIHGRISSRNGKKWGDEFVLIEGTGVPGALDCGFGDPALVIDSETDEVLLMTVCGETPYPAPTTTRQNPNRVAMFRSHDKGHTWEPWVEVTEEIYTLFDDSVHGCVQSCFVTSGQIFQSRIHKVGSHYRLYIALAARPNGNRVIYSDDFGKTWAVLGGKDALPAPHGDESKCEELPDGSVVISSREMGGRYFNIYRYDDVAAGTGEWGEAVYSAGRRKGCASVENACNGGLLILPAVRTSDFQDVSLALHSVPLGPQRRNVGIYYKEVYPGISVDSLASNWQGPYRVSEKPSAYSTMIQLHNGNVAFYYEECDSLQTRGYDMIYKELSVARITDGRYEVSDKR